MEEIRPGMLAYSLAGHDKGSLYYIVESGREIRLAFRWKTERYSFPKRKNRKHIQVIKKGAVEAPEPLTNEAVKRIIKQYLRKEL
ncbi:MAG: RNA-binding protein [Lachnospiraceae bacterium]